MAVSDNLSHFIYAVGFLLVLLSNTPNRKLSSLDIQHAEGADAKAR